MKKPQKAKAAETVSAEQRNFASSENQLGAVSIHLGVLATIAKKTIGQIAGVSSLTKASLVGNVAELVGSNAGDRPVTVELDGAVAKVTVKFNVEYGYNIPEVSASIQQAVATEIENIAGVKVGAVNIVVSGLEEKKR